MPQELNDYLAEAKKRSERADNVYVRDWVASANDVPILLAMVQAARAAHSGYASDAAEEAMQSVLDDAWRKESK